MALNVLHLKKEKIWPAYVSNYRQVMLLMISKGEKWHYLAVKNFLALLTGIT